MNDLNLRNILVAIDGSKNSNRALDAGIYLAKQCNAKLSGVYVVPFGARLAFEGINRAIKEEYFKEGKKYLADAAKKTKNKGISFNSEILESRSPGGAIAKHAYKPRKKFDLIIMGNRGHGAATEVFLGSVSHHVMHKSKTPVLIVK